MIIKKTLTTIVFVLAGALTLGGVGCNSKSNNQAQPQHRTEKISGRIVDIDEDSFAIEAPYKGANFEIEHFRIETSEGKIYKLIFPGPSNYKVGDKVDFIYKPQQRIRYQDLIKDYERHKEMVYSIYPLQEGYFDADGIILR